MRGYDNAQPTTLKIASARDILATESILIRAVDCRTLPSEGTASAVEIPKGVSSYFLG